MGCMGITHASGEPLPDDEAVRVIRQAREMGYSFFDTAECYVGERADGSIAHNEDVVGCALADVRDSVVIASKFGVTHAPDKTIVTDSSPATIRASVEGFLTGAYSSKTVFEGAKDYRAGMPQYTEEGERRAEPLVRLVAELAESHNATPAQVSLAWMLGKRPWIVPIPGSRKESRLRENLGAADVKLADEEIARIDALLDGLDLMVFGGHKVR